MNRLLLALLLAGVVLPAAGQSPPPKRSAQPNSFVLTLKAGDLKVVEESQTIVGNDWILERSANDIAAIEGETRLQGTENVSLGGEALRYNILFRPASASAPSDTIYTRAFLLKSKYYFLPGSPWQPYVGGGFGFVWAFDYSGPLHTAEGLGYQAVAGMQLRSERVGLRVEYMGLRARLNDDPPGRLDVSTHGLFVGVSFYFGRR